MFEHLLDRMPDLAPSGPAERLRSSFINGIKHLPVTFTPGVPSTPEHPAVSSRRGGVRAVL